MTGVIYADVLFIINAYVTYALCAVTGMLLSLRLKRLRLLISGVLGGLGSLFILVPDISNSALGLLRTVLCLLLCFTAFKYNGIRQLIRQLIVFLSVNFLLAGFMLAIWYFVSPTAVYYNSGIVYFDIDALSLIVLTAICYVFIRLFALLTSLRTPKNRIYDMTLTVIKEEYTLRGFLDTGNNLKDPFTSADVVIVSREALKDIFPEKITVEKLKEYPSLKIRYLPCTTVSGGGLIPVFRCEKMRIRGISADFTAENVLVGISEEKIKNGEFQALLPEGIFQNNYTCKGEDYEEAQGFIV